MARLKACPFKTGGLAMINPTHRKAYDCSQGDWQPVDRLLIANSPVDIPLDPLWKKLNELHS